MTHLSIKRPEFIQTSNREQEIWNFIDDLASEYFCREFMRKNSWKIANHIFKMKKGLKDIEFFRPIRKKDIGKVVLEITNNARQATDFYTASKNLPLPSRPVLLYYTFEKLASILALVTFREPPVIALNRKMLAYFVGIAWHVVLSHDNIVLNVVV